MIWQQHFCSSAYICSIYFDIPDLAFLLLFPWKRAIAHKATIKSRVTSKIWIHTFEIFTDAITSSSLLTVMKIYFTDDDGFISIVELHSGPLFRKFDLRRTRLTTGYLHEETMVATCGARSDYHSVEHDFIPGFYLGCLWVFSFRVSIIVCILLFVF